MLPVNVRDTIGELPGLFGDLVGSEVTGVLKLIVKSADQSAAAENGECVRVRDAEICRKRNVIEWRRVPKFGFDPSKTEFVDDVGRESMRLAECERARIVCLQARPETGRKCRQSG